MNIQKTFIGATIVAATLISSAAFADSGSKLNAFDGIPSESVQAKELDAVSGQGNINFYPKPSYTSYNSSISNIKYTPYTPPKSSSIFGSFSSKTTPWTDFKGNYGVSIPWKSSWKW